MRSLNSSSSSVSWRCSNPLLMDSFLQARSRASHERARFEPAPRRGCEMAMVAHTRGAPFSSRSYRSYSSCRSCPCSRSCPRWYFRLNCWRLCWDYKAAEAASWATPRVCTVPGKGQTIKEQPNQDCCQYMSTHKWKVWQAVDQPAV